MDMHQLMGNFQKRALALDDRARQIAPNLFLFDEYYPKRIPENICNDEVAFWYLIIDLYGLFHDAGKYIFDTPEWTCFSGATVKAFHDALNEMRSVFCHNKPPTAYLPRLITDSSRLNNLVSTWTDQSKPAANLTGSSDIAIPYRELFDLFLAAAMKVLDLIDKELLNSFENYVQRKDDAGIYNNWFTPIFNWYWNNTTVYIRAWNSYCNRNSSSVSQAYRNAHDIKNIDNKLKYWLTNHNVGKREQEQFRYNMYYRHFSLNAEAAVRQKLTPHNLFEPLLRAFDNKIILNRSLFAPDSD